MLRVWGQCLLQLIILVIWIRFHLIRPTQVQPAPKKVTTSLTSLQPVHLQGKTHLRALRHRSIRIIHFLRKLLTPWSCFLGARHSATSPDHVLSQLLKCQWICLPLGLRLIAHKMTVLSATVLVQTDMPCCPQYAHLLNHWRLQQLFSAPHKTYDKQDCDMKVFFHCNFLTSLSMFAVFMIFGKQVCKWNQNYGKCYRLFLCNIYCPTLNKQISIRIVTKVYCNCYNSYKCFWTHLSQGIKLLYILRRIFMP